MEKKEAYRRMLPMYGAITLAYLITYYEDLQEYDECNVILSVLEDLIRTFSLENSLILDSFCGSGSTCIAALNSSRNYIGIEKDLTWCENIQKRLQIYKRKN